MVAGCGIGELSATKELLASLNYESIPQAVENQKNRVFLRKFQLKQFELAEMMSEI